MSPSIESDELSDPEFIWAKKRGLGGKNKDVQFYESFTYDGVDYTLYDCVYMYKHGLPAPYIGKLLKHWETAEGMKRIKVQWFFRPSEISYYLKDVEVMDNELFFASGDGIGLADINPLEAIAGKCNVVCTSMDSRNRQPSDQELQMSDYFFYRVFDVKSCTISDQMGDKVGGLEVDFVFNRREGVGTLDAQKLDSDEKHEAKNVIACKETLKIAGNSSPQQLLDNNANCALGEEDANEISSRNREITHTTLEKRSTTGTKIDSIIFEKKNEEVNPPVNHVEKGVKNASQSFHLDEAPSKRAKFDGSVSSETLTLLPNEEFSGSGRDKSCDKEGSRGAAKRPPTLSSSTKKPLGISSNKELKEKEKLNLGHDKSLIKEKRLANTSSFTGEGHMKKAKLDNLIKRSEDAKNNKITNLKENTSSGETKKSPKCTTFGENNMKSSLGEGASKEHHSDKAKTHVGETKFFPRFAARDNKAKPRLGEGPSKEHNEKDDKRLNDNLPNPFSTNSKDGAKVGGKVIVVTPRPPEKPTWIKFSWEQQMKTAHDQGRLVLLQNLDPEYTSGEVEAIIYHSFEMEICTARMVPHTAISNPCSGQAFVVFKTRNAADNVVKKLDKECLMLPNQRPLVACYGVLPKCLEKLTVFVGHLAIDKDRRQIQREMKGAVSTSHYSQHNTIEFEMAMDWCLLQSKSDKWWEILHEVQGKELKRLMETLKSK